MPEIAPKEERRVLNVRKRRFEGQGRVLGKALVPKMPGTCEHHRDAVLVAGLDALVIALGAAGLDDAGHAVCGKHVDVVAEREERVTCAGKAALLHAFALAKVLGAFAGEQCGVNAVGLTRAHANAGLALGDQDGVGLNALADLPGKLELGHLSVGGLAVGGERKGRGILGHVVDLLHQHAAVDGAQLHLGTVVHAAGSQHAQVGALGHALERPIGVARGDDDLDELLVLVGEVLNMVAELKAQGTTIHMATHEMSFAHEAADRIVLLRHGVIAENGTPAEVMDESQDPETIEFFSHFRH